MDFDQYQMRARETDTIPHSDEAFDKVVYCAAGASAHVGELASLIKKKLRDGEDFTDLQLKRQAGEQLGYLLWYVSTLATELSLTLDGIAVLNLKFNDSRWKKEVEGGQFEFNLRSDYDSDYPSHERLPDALWVRFECYDGAPPTLASFVIVDGDTTEVPFGNVIDDNSHSNDGYRFHDTFHFGYFVYLNWSPVIRKLLSRKRKSIPDTDRIEDGARARDREEAVTTLIYEYVLEHQFLGAAKSIDTDFLKLAALVVADLEVGSAQPSAWETAIIQSARVQKQLMQNNGGWVRANRKTRELYFSKSGPATMGSR